MNPAPVIADPVRILIVDDERHNRQLLEIMLAPEGFHLLTAASGEEALEIVAQQPPDLILLDIMMPGMDGYQVAAKIKATPATKDIPLIMVTALDDRASRMRGLSAGAEDYLSKPVDRAELVVRVKNLSRLKASGEHKYSQKLEGEVGSRTADLLSRTKALEHEAVVRDALEQVRLDQLRFKDEFLSHVSHELRSPLTAIKQFTSILMGEMSGELNQEQQDYLHIVLKNISQLQSMIDDLLEVTRLETGKLTVEPEHVSLANAVNDTFNTFGETARAKGVTLTCDLPPDLPAVYADPTRLRQILIILLDNAIKFTPEGGAARIQARLFPEDPRLLLVDVSDTGCGISPELSERVFERLYQASETIQASRKGLGLGLYICKELVSRQGGRIWVNRRPEGGSTFSFTLPICSLNTLLAPLLKNGEWPAESVALVTVETGALAPWPTREAQEAWSHEAHQLLQRCVLPDLDLLLPSTSLEPQRERFFVAAFADDRGVAVLANRIRGQFERLPRVLHSEMTVSISCTMLEPAPPDAGAGTDAIVATMATHLEEAINSPTTPAAPYHA